MGYDMYVVDIDGRRVHCDNDELHRTLYGGKALADELVAAGLGYWSAGYDNRGKHPKPPPGVEWDCTDYGQWVGPGADDFIQKEHAHLRATWDERPGIAVYKLCGSNDDWWVTKAECESALKLWEAEGQPNFDRLRDVLTFLRAAAKHEGFRVG